MATVPFSSLVTVFNETRFMLVSTCTDCSRYSLKLISRCIFIKTYCERGLTISLTVVAIILGILNIGAGENGFCGTFLLKSVGITMWFHVWL